MDVPRQAKHWTVPYLLRKKANIMPNDPHFLDYILDQASDLDGVRTRNMFGGATLYYKDKVMGLVCDNQFFLKPNEAALKLLGEPKLAPAYEGSKDFYLLTDELEDSRKFCELLRQSERVLPAGKKKK